jgi:hypothetical protein
MEAPFFIVTSVKSSNLTPFFIVTAVKTSNITNCRNAPELLQLKDV